MADRFIGIVKGGTLDSVTQGSSTTSKAIELRIDLAVTMTKQEVLLALEHLEHYIEQNAIWPMA